MHDENISPAEKTEDLSGSETNLVVEDDEQVRELCQTILSQQGYLVLVTGKSTEALTLLSSISGPVHLLLTDVIMPGLNGKELSNRTVCNYPGIKVIYMSGYPDNVLARHRLLDEGVDFIKKPFTTHGLATKVKEVLGRN